MILLRLDVPTFTNGGGFLLACLLTVAVCLIVATIRTGGAR